MAITTSPDNSKPLNLDTIKDTVTKALSPLATELPEFHVNITDGRFNLADEHETVLLFSDVQSEISCISKGILIRMECTSNICKGISVNADFDQKNFKGKGNVELKHFQPQTLINRFLPNAAYRITKPINKVSVSLKTDGSNDLQVVIDEIRIESPDIEMEITKSPENSNEAKEPFNPNTIKDTVAKVLSPLAAELPEFHAIITNGKFNVIEEDKTVIALNDVQADIG